MLLLQTFTPKEQARGFIMPNFIMENPNLSISAKMLFGILCDYARDSNFCYPSKQTLAIRLRCSINSIRNWIKELIKHGLVQTLFNGRVDIFYLFCPQNTVQANHQNETKIENTSIKKIYQKGSNFAHDRSNFAPKSNVKEIILNTPLPPEDRQANKSPNQQNEKKRVCDFNAVNLEFETFWEVYPKKEKKEEARRLWHRCVRLGKIPPLEKLQRALTYFLDTVAWQRQEGRFIPYLLNFIRGFRWEEYFEIERKSKQTQDNKQKNAQNTSCLCESVKEREERFKQEEQTRQEEKTKLAHHRKEWDRFSSFFLPDTTFKSVIAEVCFLENFNKENTIFQINTFCNMTPYEYFTHNNVLTPKTRNGANS